MSPPSCFALIIQLPLPQPSRCRPIANSAPRVLDRTPAAQAESDQRLQAELLVNGCGSNDQAELIEMAYLAALSGSVYNIRAE